MNIHEGKGQRRHLCLCAGLEVFIQSRSLIFSFQRWFYVSMQAMDP